MNPLVQYAEKLAEGARAQVARNAEIVRKNEMKKPLEKRSA